MPPIHALTLALVLAVACDRDVGVRSEPAVLLARSESLQTHCAEHVLPYFAAMASVFRGSALSLLGRTDRGLALIMEGLVAYRATGALVYVPKFLLLLADCYRNAGEPKEGLNNLDEAAQLIEATQIGSAESGMYRRKGEIFLVLGDLDAAETSFLRAIDIARRQKARLFELQAASALARLWRDQSRRVEARNLLAPIYHWFTEGFDAPDLKDAKALLEQLKP
jgi:predicted ATPase